MPILLVAYDVNARDTSNAEDVADAADRRRDVEKFIASYLREEMLKGIRVLEARIEAAARR